MRFSPATTLLILVVTLSVTACSRLSQSDNTLRHQYLAITPPGTSMDKSVSLIKTKIKPKGGLEIRENTPCLKRERPEHQKGSHSIRVNMGWYYWGVTETNVYGEWCFNDNRQLVDIIVYREPVDDPMAPSAQTPATR